MRSARISCFLGLLGALVASGTQAAAPAKAQASTAPERASKEDAQGPSFLDALFEDEVTLYRKHVRFEQQPEVDMLGMPATVKLTRNDVPRSYGVLVSLKRSVSTCEPFWDALLEALNARLKEGQPSHEFRHPKGAYRTANWKAGGSFVQARCYSHSFTYKPDRPFMVEVDRTYAPPADASIEQLLGPEETQIDVSSTPSFLDVILQDASAFLRPEGRGPQGRTVDLAGVPGRVMATWRSRDRRMEVRVEPRPGAVTSCEPIWDRILRQLTRRLGKPDDVPISGPRKVGDFEIRTLHTRLHLGERRAYWHDEVPVTVICFEDKGGDGRPPSVSLSVSRSY